MDVYLVGGAVRDALLGLPVKDKDWVVVGAHPQQMLDLGFTQVGQDFPVFLHPKTKQEHALARTERKSGKGYTGFEVYAAPDVSLEEDLIRRDLTINAIAQDSQGTLHDPYGGIEDLQQRRLRHVSPAFSEDPLRVLRVARFAARFAPQGFTIAAETLNLMTQMSASGELDALTSERVWQEWEKALSSPRPDIFIAVLRQCGALKTVMPELDALFGVPQPPQHHPEIDTGIHTLLVAEQAATLSTDTMVRFAAQLHDLGKALTAKENWPRHLKHELLGKAAVTTLCQRLKVPNEYRQLAVIVCTEHTNVHRAFELRPDTIIKLFDRIDVWRRPERLEQLLTAAKADCRGRTGLEDAPYPQKAYLLACFNAAVAVTVQPIIAAGFKGAEIRAELGRQRAEAVAEIKAHSTSAD
ncbi:multifunctional CCA addition/repair protein [Thaumasiovibrio sp. DFM-14]|uniref:multifunctional CCA addition/repair protein n=1 Tax=Thaumasiovibrio sp. DFM-14 TaxID=3384792 RepID=UPI0039A18195